MLYNALINMSEPVCILYLHKQSS